MNISSVLNTSVKLYWYLENTKMKNDVVLSSMIPYKQVEKILAFCWISGMFAGFAIYGAMMFDLIIALIGSLGMMISFIATALCFSYEKTVDINTVKD